MKHIQNFEIVLDADDVLLDCNEYALNLLKQDSSLPEDVRKALSIDHVTDWGLLGIPEDRRLSYLQSADFYRHQPMLPGADAFLKSLMEIANVTIMTAVYPQFMGERIERLQTLFPFFPMSNILMGQRKEMLRSDIMLDDGAHNLYSSDSRLPVLFRRPWNRKVSGICCINNYEEFLSLVSIMLGIRKDEEKSPKILCIVGPSGSDKHAFADQLCEDPSYEQIRTCTTARDCGKNLHVSEETFHAMQQSGSLLESTYYGGQRYGLPRSHIDTALRSGHTAVAIMDISGCMAVYNRYPGQTLILYLDRDKRSCVRSILEKQKLTNADKTERILSIDLEQKNKILADLILPTGERGSCREAVRAVAELIHT